MALNSEERQPLFSSSTAWILRMLLACLLLFAGEILLWNDPGKHAFTDWLMTVPVYVLLAAVLLDLTARYRIRDVYGVMLVIAIYALGAGLLANPTLTLSEFPRTLITRVLGGNGTLGLYMFGVLLVLMKGRSRRYGLLMLGYSVWLGFYWGVWMRWTGELTERGGNSPTLATMFAYAGGVMIIVLLLYMVLLRRANRSEGITPRGLYLTVAEMGMVAAGLFIVLMIRIAQEAITGAAIVGCITLLVLCWGILWSQRSPRGSDLLDVHLPPAAPNTLWLIAAAVIFTSMTALAYHRPLVEIGAHNQYSFMEFAFAAAGFVWMPLVAAVISVRTVDRFSRTNQW